jgi:hypothetical protein
MAMASQMKLMAVLAAGTEYIYLLDESSHGYITGMSGSDEGAIFKAESVPAQVLGVEGFEGLTFYIRPSEKADEKTMYAKELMENIASQG